MNISFEIDYERIKKIVAAKNISLPCTAKNDKDEDVIIENDIDGNGNHCYRLTTLQKNSWCRINTYYQDGTIDETFEK